MKQPLKTTYPRFAFGPGISHSQSDGMFNQSGRHSPYAPCGRSLTRPITVADANAYRESTHTLPVFTFKIINVYPHDQAAFTEGLVIDGGVLYEGTRLNGRSALRRVDAVAQTF